MLAGIMVPKGTKLGGPDLGAANGCAAMLWWFLVIHKSNRDRCKIRVSCAWFPNTMTQDSIQRDFAASCQQKF